MSWLCIFSRVFVALRLLGGFVPASWPRWFTTTVPLSRCTCVSHNAGFLFSVAAHAARTSDRRHQANDTGLVPWQGPSNSRRAALPLQAVVPAAGPAVDAAVDVASHTHAPRRAGLAANGPRPLSRLPGRGSSIQNAHGSAYLGCGRGEGSAAAVDDVIKSGASWTASAPCKGIIKKHSSAARKPRTGKDTGGTPAVASPVHPLLLPLPSVADQQVWPVGAKPRGVPALNNTQDDGSVPSRQLLAAMERLAAPDHRGQRRLVESTGAAISGQAVDLAPASEVDPPSEAALDRLLQRVSAEEQLLKARWSHLSAFLGAATEFRALLADCERCLRGLSASASKLHDDAEKTRRALTDVPSVGGNGASAGALATTVLDKPQVR